jgi:hypothetical protein
MVKPSNTFNYISMVKPSNSSDIFPLGKQLLSKTVKPSNSSDIFPLGKQLLSKTVAEIQLLTNHLCQHC